MDVHDQTQIGVIGVREYGAEKLHNVSRYPLTSLVLTGLGLLGTWVLLLIRCVGKKTGPSRFPPWARKREIEFPFPGKMTMIVDEGVV